MKGGIGLNLSILGDLKEFYLMLLSREIDIKLCQNYTKTHVTDPSVKVNSTYSLTTSTLLHRLVLLSVCFIYPMSGRYSTIWDRKGWPGSEIQMYYGSPWANTQPIWKRRYPRVAWKTKVSSIYSLNLIIFLF